MKKRVVAVGIMVIGLVACGKQEQGLGDILPTISVDLGLDVATPTAPDRKSVV